MSIHEVTQIKSSSETQADQGLQEADKNHVEITEVFQLHLPAIFSSILQR